MSTSLPRYSLTLTPELLKAIDDYRFENRIASRSQATVKLIELGLQKLQEQEQKKQTN